MIRNDLPRSLIDNPMLDRWVQFEGEGLVRLGTGKVELGQGVLTALSQIAAEELEVEPGRITIVSGETGRSPEEGFTAGSQSIEASGGAIRLVCAEVRQMAVAQAADRIGCRAEAVSVQDGHFLRDGQPTALSYWTLADALDLHRPATGSAPIRAPERLRIIGQSLKRVDLPEKLSDAGFIHDLRPEGLLHARILRQPSPGARLLSLDEPRIQRAAGAPITILRVNDFLAFAADDEAAADRALIAAQHAAAWDGASPATPAHADPRFLLGLPTIDRTVTAPARTAFAPRRPRGRGHLHPPLHRPRLDRPELRPRALGRGRADRLVAHPGRRPAAQLDRPRAAARPGRRHRPPPPRRRLLRP